MLATVAVILMHTLEEEISSALSSKHAQRALSVFEPEGGGAWPIHVVK